MWHVRPADKKRVDVSEVDGTVLAAHPLPVVRDHTSKFDRGAVLVVGGSRETPGGVLLAGTATLRTGAGRVRVATASSIAGLLSVAMPEARVTGLPETADGNLGREAAECLGSAVEGVDVVVIGSGCTSPDATGTLLTTLAPRI